MKLNYLINGAGRVVMVLFAIAWQLGGRADILKLDVEGCAFEFVEVPGCAVLFGKTELTQKQWKSVMKSNPSVFRGEALPVENISWKDACSYIDRLNSSRALRRQGYVAVLPSEEDWMVACGPAAENYSDFVWDRSNAGRRTHPVALKSPNRYGLYDMLGNVYEYCRDVHDGNMVWPKGGCWNTKRPTSEWHGKNATTDRCEKLGMRVCLMRCQKTYEDLTERTECVMSAPRETATRSKIKSEAYATHLAFFRGAASLWIGESLVEKIARLKKEHAIVRIVFEETWANEKAIYVVSVSSGDIKSVTKEIPDGTQVDVDMATFRALCDQRAMLAYNKRVYLNAPVSKVHAGEEGPIGYLLLRGIYGLRADLGINLPDEKLRVRLSGIRAGGLSVGGVFLTETLSCDKIMDSICEAEQRKINAKWKKEYDEKRKKLPRKPPVVNGNVDKIVKKSDGTFVIPKEAPPTTRTITWTETVWADGHGSDARGVPVSVRVPVGERECHRTKKITSQYNYADLRQKLEEYERNVKEIENSKPDIVDDAMRKRLFSKISSFEFEVEK